MSDQATNRHDAIVVNCLLAIMLPIIRTNWDRERMFLEVMKQSLPLCSDVPAMVEVRAAAQNLVNHWAGAKEPQTGVYWGIIIGDAQRAILRFAEWRVGEVKDSLENRGAAA